MITRLPLVLLALAALLRGGLAPRAVSQADAVTLWVWHYDAQMGEAAVPTYRDLLEAVPADVPIVVGVFTSRDAEVFRSRLGLDARPDPRIRFVETGRRLSGWARDRYIIFSRGHSNVVALPPTAAVAPGWDGDLDVARALPKQEPGLAVLDAGLALEGGNVLVAPEHVFIGVEGVLDCGELLQIDADAVRERIEALFGRHLVVVADGESLLAGDHVDMFLSVVGDRRLLLGDPRLALEDIPGGRSLGLHFTRDTQLDYAADYDRIAHALAAEGFQVERVPILHSEEGTILSWNNAVVEVRDGRKRAYVPNYGLPDLDEAAYDCWRALGFEVFPVSAERLIVMGGAVRCATNAVLRPR